MSDELNTSEDFKRKTESTIIEITADTLKIEKEKITSKSNFVTDLGADSIAVVELSMAFEEAFDCQIPEEDSVKMLTVHDVTEYIANQKNNAF